MEDLSSIRLSHAIDSVFILKGKCVLLAKMIEKLIYDMQQLRDVGVAGFREFPLKWKTSIMETKVMKLLVPKQIMLMACQTNHNLCMS